MTVCPLMSHPAFPHAEEAMFFGTPYLVHCHITSNDNNNVCGYDRHLRRYIIDVHCVEGMPAVHTCSHFSLNIYSWMRSTALNPSLGCLQLTAGALHQLNVPYPATEIAFVFDLRGYLGYVLNPDPMPNVLMQQVSEIAPYTVARVCRAAYLPPDFATANLNLDRNFYILLCCDHTIPDNLPTFLIKQLHSLLTSGSSGQLLITTTLSLNLILEDRSIFLDSLATTTCGRESTPGLSHLMKPDLFRMGPLFASARLIAWEERSPGTIS